MASVTIPQDTSAVSQGSPSFHGAGIFQHVFHQQPLLWCLVASAIMIIAVLSQHAWFQRDSLPTVNRLFPFEPSLFIRLRWAVMAQTILNNAYRKFKGGTYRLARGDTDFIVLPPRYIPELNSLPLDAINSRKSHNFSLLGGLTGMDVVRRTGFHVKILLSRISPTITERFEDIATRLQNSTTNLLPQETDAWSAVGPLDIIVRSISEGVTSTLFGYPLCDNRELIQLCHEHTKNVFIVAFYMRFIPELFQPFVVHLLPAKWRLVLGWKAFKRIVEPEVQCRVLQNTNASKSDDLISWMIRDARNSTERDPWVLTQLAASVAAGATYSTANFISQALADLIAHPEMLKELQAEIRTKHSELQQAGKVWNLAALNDLPKLESAMKETTRLSPGTLLVYSRVIERDHVLSDGLSLYKGQFVTVASHAHNTAEDGGFLHPKVYDGLRFYHNKEQEHTAGAKRQHFYSLDDDILTWGSGRWACPGRYLANLFSKVLLVKFLDEYSWKFVDGKAPPVTALHEFPLFSPETKLMCRRRPQSQCLGIRFTSNSEAPDFP